MTLLRVTDPESGKSWTVEAIDENDPHAGIKFLQAMTLFGSAYIYKGPLAPKEHTGLKTILERTDVAQQDFDRKTS
jgi:hypothetical protein